MKFIEFKFHKISFDGRQTIVRHQLFTVNEWILEPNVEGSKHQRERVYSNILMIALFEYALLHKFYSGPVSGSEYCILSKSMEIKLDKEENKTKWRQKQ